MTIDKEHTRDFSPDKNRISRQTAEAPADEKQSADQQVQQTQKGKNKVDGDPSKESDQPIRQAE